MARLSLICPTIGRGTLSQLVDSVRSQMHPGDEFIIVGDGPQPGINAAGLNAMPGVRYVETPTRTGDFGCTPCDYGIEIATGDLVFFIGDDDVCPEGAFDAIHKGVESDPDVPHIFSMMHTGRKLGNSINCCYVSGQQIVVPRDMSKMPRMADCDPGQIAVSDWVFIDKVHRAWNMRTLFHQEIIAILYNQNNGRML